MVMLMKIFVIILDVIIALFLIYSLVGGLLLFDRSIRRKPKSTETPPNDNSYSTILWNKKLENIKWLFSQNLKKIEIKSFDNLNLSANVLENNTKKVMILMHGFRNQDFTDFSLSTKLFYQDGYTLILPHQRAHDQSEGKHLSYGVNERKDCKMWIDWAINTYGADCEIVLYGVSMGCATVLMTVGYNLPKNVKACIADCGYTSARAVFNYVIKREMKLPVAPVIFVCNLLCKTFGKFSIDDYSPLQAMETCKTPVIFIHGDEDRFVPTYMSKVNYEACESPKELLIVKGVRHAACFEEEPELCFNTAKTFVDKFISVPREGN